MLIRGNQISFKKVICMKIYYAIAIHLPISRKYFGIGGKVRNALCRRIFKKCFETSNIEKGASFGTGFNVELGEYSGIGINADIPSNTIIGDYVMMGPNCVILGQNHCFDRTDIPIMKQGYKRATPTIIEDDVWIGRDVTMTPGRHISKGSIIAAGCVLCKDFPEYSVIGGNPSKLIKIRK